MPNPKAKHLIAPDGTVYDIKDEEAVERTGDTMTGILVAQNNTAYTTKQVRNIIFSTGEPTVGDGNNGDIWIVYKE